MKYEITLKNHFKALESIIFITTCLIGCIIYLGQKNGYERDAVGFISASIIISIASVYIFILNITIIIMD